MARTPQDLGKGQLTTSATTLFTSAASTDTIIRRVTFYNTHTAPVEVTVYKVRSGASAGDAGTTVAKRSVQSGKSWVCLEIEGHVFQASGSLQALADVTNVVDYNVSGTAVTGS